VTAELKAQVAGERTRADEAASRHRDEVDELTARMSADAKRAQLQMQATKQA